MLTPTPGVHVLPLRALPAAGADVAFCDVASALAARAGDVTRLPYCLRVVAENVARNLPLTGDEGEAALQALAQWQIGRAHV